MSHLCLRDVEWLGFDLDHTIVRYRLPALNELVFNCIGKYLVEKKGFDKGIVERGFLPSFPLRGLVLDAFKGNFLVLSASGKVLTGAHGTRTMDAAELKRVYPDGLPTVAEATRRNDKLQGFHAFTTFFDMPTSVLVAHYVDLCDEQGRTEYIRIAMELLGAFEYCFNPENEVDGGYFCEIKSHPDKYLIKCTDSVKQWLQAARTHHVGLFLLTNSLSGYTNFLLKHCFGEDWRHVFDLVIVGGKKPDFFTKTGDKAHSFHAVSEHMIGEPLGPDGLVRGGFVAHGNLRDLTPFLARHGRGAQLGACGWVAGSLGRWVAGVAGSLGWLVRWVAGVTL
jgi:5'-nucleotidase